jgi:hypothetical protein
VQHRAEECDKQRHEERDVLVVRKEERATNDSQRIRASARLAPRGVAGGRQCRARWHAVIVLL